MECLLFLLAAITTSRPFQNSRYGLGDLFYFRIRIREVLFHEWGLPELYLYPFPLFIWAAAVRFHREAG